MDYDLDAQPSSYTVTGVSNGWDYDRSFNAAPGAFTVAGNFPVNVTGDILGSQFKASAFAVNNFTEKVGDAVSYWKLEAKNIAGNGFTEIPMQYFKATAWSFRSWLKSGGVGANEVFIPSASPYAQKITDAQFFRVKRFFKLPDGTTYDHIWFYVSSFAHDDGTVVPMTKDFTYGQNQDSCTVKGAFSYFYEIDDPVFDPIVLTGVRSYTTGSGGRKVVCNLDTVLKPGMQVEIDNDIFTALTISFFVSPSDQYMEVFDYHV